MLPLLLLLSGACSWPEVQGIDPFERVFPLVLDAPGLIVAGVDTTVLVDSAGGRREAALVASPDPRGTTCPAVSAPRCLDLGAPLQALGRTTLDVRGDGAFTVRLPVPPRRMEVGLQAVGATLAQDTMPDVSQVVVVTVLRPQDDEDGDGLDNRAEVQRRTELLVADTDGDGLSDGDEVHRYDSNPRSLDGDGDGLSDADEVLRYGTDPQDRDTDGDDVGSNGYDDRGEVRYKRTDPLDPDSDDDGLLDGEESRWRALPLDPDFDDDGHLDGAEVAAGTDPLDRHSPLPWPAVDTASEDTGLPRCAEGEIFGCWDACTPDLRGDADCDRWLDCPRYHGDWEDCAVPAAPGCPAGTSAGCWGRCEPVATLGDGLCQEAWSCPARAWDDGDCPAPPGAALQGFVEVDGPEDLDVLAGVAHLDGVLRFLPGAPRDVVLRDLVTVGGVEAESSDLVSLELPALTHVTGGVRLRGVQELKAPALVGIGRELYVGGDGVTAAAPPGGGVVAASAGRVVAAGAGLPGRGDGLPAAPPVGAHPQRGAEAIPRSHQMRRRSRSRAVRSSPRARRASPPPPPRAP